MEAVVIPEGTVEIGHLAFANCAGLKSAALPQSVRKMKNFTRKGKASQTIFNNDANLTVAVAPKSYAEKYCRRNNIAMIN